MGWRGTCVKEEVLVEKESYLLELTRYVVLNPVRAHRVNDLLDWRWSSYPAMINKVLSPEWLETDWLLSQFSKSRQKAIQLYIDFVRQGVGLPSIWEDTKCQVFLGSDNFIENAQVISSLNSDDSDLKEIPRIQRRAIAKKLSWYQKNHNPRDMAMAKAYLSGDYSMKEIAAWFGVHYSTVSRAVKKLENA